MKIAVSTKKKNALILSGMNVRDGKYLVIFSSCDNNFLNHLCTDFKPLKETSLFW